MAQKSIRSVRASDKTWKTAQKRAAKEGFTMSHVINELTEGYAIGVIDLPTVEKTFTPTRQETDEQK